IFHQNQGAKARTQAEVQRLSRQRLRQESVVALEVRQAYAQYQRASEQLDLWRNEIRPQAEVAARAAAEGLKEDAVSLLVVLETSRQLNNALQQEILALADVQRAIAELERSVGRCLASPANSVDVFEQIDPPPPLPEDFAP
ncbi:MAG: TolC family protein, partial [Planctomycetales bacterium]|nr:TolC family protein [Planctomycetales bacterium]